MPTHQLLLEPRPAGPLRKPGQTDDDHWRLERNFRLHGLDFANSLYLEFESAIFPEGHDLGHIPSRWIVSASELHGNGPGH